MRDMNDIINDKILELQCSLGNIDKVRTILESDEDIDIHIMDEAPFVWSCENGHLEIVKLLIEYSNNNNDPIDIDIGFNTGFVNACQTGTINIVKYLLEYCNENKIKLDMNTAVMNACKSVDSKVIDYLYEYYTSPNIQFNEIKNVTIDKHNSKDKIGKFIKYFVYG